MNSRVFKGDALRVTEVDIDAPLTNSKKPYIDYFSSAYQHASKHAEEENNHIGAEVFRFLADLTGFYIDPDIQDQPFRPLWETTKGRTFIPADMTQEDLDVVKMLFLRTSDPSLKARLADICWVQSKDHFYLSQAAEAYKISGMKLFGEDDAVDGIKEFRRGVQLASKMGRSNSAFLDIISVVEAMIQKQLDTKEVFGCIKLIEIMLHYSCGDAKKYALIAAKLGDRLRSENDGCRARYCFGLEEKWHRLAKDKTSEIAAIEKAGKAILDEAELHIAKEQPSYLAASGLLAQAIEVLRQAQTPPDQIADLRRRMLQYQQKAMNEMSVYSASYDISDLVSDAEARVKSPEFSDALKKFAFGERLSDPSKIREESIRAAQENPLSHTISHIKVDESGRPIAIRKGILNLADSEYEAQLEELMFENAARVNWALRATAYINPARIQILNDHRPSFEDICSVVQDNSLVPCGHEGLILRGIHAGFHGDLVLASHLVALQIENSLRCFFQAHGVEISNLMFGGLQPAKMLGKLLNLQEAKDLLGAEVVFELRGHLIEKSGFDLRNRIAHGFVSEEECTSVAALSLWWLFLRLCLMAKNGIIPMKSVGIPASDEPGESKLDGQ